MNANFPFSLQAIEVLQRFHVLFFKLLIYYLYLEDVAPEDFFHLVLFLRNFIAKSKKGSTNVTDARIL